MMFHVEIDTTGAAFEDDSTREVARILTALVARMDGDTLDDASFPLRDVNGNRCGNAWSDDDDGDPDRTRDLSGEPL